MTVKSFEPRRQEAFIDRHHDLAIHILDDTLMNRLNISHHEAVKILSSLVEKYSKEEGLRL